MGLSEIPDDLGLLLNRPLYELTFGQLVALLKKNSNLGGRRSVTAGDALIVYNKPFIVGVTAVQLFQGNANRRFLVVQNNSAATIYVGFSAKPTVASGLVIKKDGYFEPYNVPTSSIWVLGASAGLAGVAIEG